MSSLSDKALLDLRGWAIGTWPDREAPGVGTDRLYGAFAKHVATMREIGWVEARDGRLHVTEAGWQSLDDLLPTTMPKLTASQEEFLEQILTKSQSASDLSYAPTLKLLAYGAVEARPQRFGGYRLIPTERGRDWGRDNGIGEPEASPAP